MMAKKCHAVIIGGGIAGTAMALFLNKIGWTSTIYEAYPKRDDIGEGLQIAPNGLHVLDTLGLANKIIDNSSIASEMCFRNQKGKVLARIYKNMKEKYGQPAVNITRSALHKVLVEELYHQGLEIHYQKRLIHLTDEEHKPAVAHFEDGASAEGDLIIGADGIHSKTREAILPDGPKPEYIGLQWIAGTIPIANVSSFNRSDRGTHMTFGQKGFFGYGNFNKKESMLMWWINVSREKERTRDEATAFSTEKTKREKSYFICVKVGINQWKN